jgi:gamma-glutamylcysteine synthetase
MDSIYRYFVSEFDRTIAARSSGERRIGAELKFPLVNADGTAASLEKTDALWGHLEARGWEPIVDRLAGRIVGAEKPGPQNSTIASCETGFCKPEFSLAHVPNLFALEDSVQALRGELEAFCEREEVYFLGYGIQPRTPPSKRLLMKKGRTCVWDKAFGANRCLCREDGDDVCLFTVNAGTHTHVSVSKEEAIDAVNVLNGFAGAQLAVTANSNIWRGWIDPQFKCVCEKLWDWWMPDKRRVGVPPRPFRDLRDYVRTVAEFRPVYVKRNGTPVVLTRYGSFHEYFLAQRPTGIDAKTGEEVAVVPESSDIELHSTCYWYNARLTRYYTVENRANDQQPPGDLLCVPALTLGLVSALGESLEVLASYAWQDLRESRDVACRTGLDGAVHGCDLADLAAQMLEVAALGLRRRELGEEQFLAPLEGRVRKRRCPADDAVGVIAEGGIASLVEARRL